MPIRPGAAMNSHTPDKARVGTDLAAARKEIRMYKMLNGKLPASLKVLGLRPYFPADLFYNAETGRVGSRTFPNM